MWAIWLLSLLGPLMLSFKKGERFFVAVIGFYGLFFWIIFGMVIGDSSFYSSAVLFGLLGVYNAYHSYKLKERKKQCQTQSRCEELSTSNFMATPEAMRLYAKPPVSRPWVQILSKHRNRKG